MQPRHSGIDPGTTLQRGNFVILSLIGQGGFGAVYRARQERLKRDVAIKMLHPGHAAHDTMVERFRREALAAASLSHPNVLPVFDFDFDETLNLWFLAMQFVPGARSLDRVTFPMEPTRAAQIIGDVASALDAAHERSIVHRDVKPANVLLDNDRPMLTDFGIAHLGNELTNITGAGLAIGTPAYMSPEQALGKEVGPASDQYSLAVMAYQLLVGRMPFSGDLPSLLYQHVHEPVPSPDIFNPNLGPDATEAILTAMRKTPGDRFPNCTAFARALAGAVDGLPMLDETVVLRRRPRTPTPLPGATSEPTVAVNTHPSTGTSLEQTRGITQPGSTEPAATKAITLTIPSFTSSPKRLASIVFGFAALAAIILLMVVRLGPGSAASTPRGPAVAPGTVLLRDSFDDPSRGFLDRVATTDRYHIGYVDGEYEIAGPRGGFVALPGTFGDTTLTVDARLNGAEAPGRTIGMVCRASEKGWYQLAIAPDERTFSIFRFTFGGALTPLIDDTPSSAILTGNTQNHIELSCYGQTIEARANGQELGRIQDATYQEGWMQLSITSKSDPEPGGEIGLRLDNLVVTQK